MPVPPESPLGQAHQRSPALVLAGALMIASGLLLANPAGATDTRWPWQILAEFPWTRRHANWALWFVTAILAIVLGATGTRRGRAPLLFGAALLLFITCAARDAGLALTHYSLAWFAGLAVLIGGFLLEAEGRWRGAARVFCALGAILVLWTLARSFDRGPEGGLESRLIRISEDALTRSMGRAIPDARQNYDIDLFSYTAAILAALLGLANLVGARGSLVARIGLVLVLLHFLVPTFHRLGVLLGDRFELGGVFTQLSEVLIHYGLALCLFAAAAAADLARLRTRAA